MSVLYGLIARQALVLAEYSLANAETEATARKLVCKVEQSPFMKTYMQGNLMFSFYTKEGISYVCVAESEVGREISVQFLEDLERGFQFYRDHAAEYSKCIKSLIDKYHADNLPAIDPLIRVERDLDRVVETTKDNLGKVIARGTHMELLKVKTAQLEVETKRIRTTARDYNFAAWVKKVKVYLLALLLWAVLGYYGYVWLVE